MLAVSTCCGTKKISTNESFHCTGRGTKNVLVGFFGSCGTRSEMPRRTWRTTKNYAAAQPVTKDSLR